MHKTNPHPLLAILVLLLLAACASIGSPRGGAYDITPPKVVRCQPANMATDNKDKRLTLTFDEYVVIENASEKVVVSPPQKEMPEIRTSGKRIHITLYDTLQENTTYTIDFADAIVDNNEGNPMGNFTYSFSTGDHIDTMEVSGTLLEAENLEPVKGMLVGLYADLSDTAFTTRPFARVARTDGRGRFTIKGVAPGRYRIYGLQDMEPAWITSNQIEAARVAMTRYCKRFGKVWIKIFPDKPITQKPAETRMGSGKGSPEYWVAVVKPGRVMFELGGVSEETAREALRLAGNKLPIKCKFVSKEEG